MYTGARGVAYNAAYVTGAVMQNLEDATMYGCYWAVQKLNETSTVAPLRYYFVYCTTLGAHHLCAAVTRGCFWVFKALGADNPLEAL